MGAVHSAQLRMHVVRLTNSISHPGVYGVWTQNGIGILNQVYLGHGGTICWLPVELCPFRKNWKTVMIAQRIINQGDVR